MADDPAMQKTYRAPGVQRGSVLRRGLDPKNADREALEEQRRTLIARQRDYYAGDQYAATNRHRLEDLCRDQRTDTLPEHERVHAYATQISESVNYLTSRLGEGFSFDAEDDDIDALLTAVIEATDALSSVNADGEIVPSTDTALRDALITGDVAVCVGWDDINNLPTIELWESEAVEFVQDNSGDTVEVVLTFLVWMPDATGNTVEQTRKRRYTLEPNMLGELEAICRTYDTENDTVELHTQEPVDTRWLGFGRIPWALLRADREGLRSYRGRSLITPQVMETADRFNSVEQTGFIISRYNSHSNVVVIGDEVMAKSLTGQTVIRKDVADVITFPEGTNAFALSLPTDPSMIEHQRSVLTDALYSSFGLVRMDPTALQGLGQVSGYALEILNGRTDATFGRVARCWRKDWANLIDLLLDVDAWRSEAGDVWLTRTDDGDVTVTVAPEYDPEATDITPPPIGAERHTAFWDVDPAQVYPNRVVKITLGTGAVVDDVKARDDFTAGLISRREALRQRGYTDEQIDDVVAEIATQQAEEAGTTGETNKFTTVTPNNPAPGTVGGTLGSFDRTTA